MSLLTVDELRKLMPKLSLANAAVFSKYLAEAMQEFEIVSKARRCAFLSQLAHESAQLRYMEEIASGAAYEGRRDLGNTEVGDGRRYKGRGPIQLTGRANYRAFGRSLGVDLLAHPELAALPEHGFRIAGLYWQLHGLNELADRLTLTGDNEDRAAFTQITKRINGGTNGLSDRLNYFRIAKQVLHVDPPSDVQEPAAPSESPAEVSPDTEVDFFGAAVNSTSLKSAGKRFWPRLASRALRVGGWLWALAEAHQIASVLSLVVLLAGAAYLVYRNREWLLRQKSKVKPLVLKLFQ